MSVSLLAASVKCLKVSWDLCWKLSGLYQSVHTLSSDFDDREAWNSTDFKQRVPMGNTKVGKKCLVQKLGSFLQRAGMGEEKRDLQATV